MIGVSVKIYKKSVKYYPREAKQHEYDAHQQKIHLIITDFGEASESADPV